MASSAAPSLYPATATARSNDISYSNESIQDPGERLQLLHHAFDYDSPTMIFSVGDSPSCQLQ